MDNIWYNRFYEKNASSILKKGKVFVLTGPRRTGKTELINKLISEKGGKMFSGTGDDMRLREILSSQYLEQIKLNLGAYDVVFIDEAQKIPELGMGLKLLIDHSPEMILVITGSSSFSLSKSTGEPLTGRQIIRQLFPVSVLELFNQFGGMYIQEMLEELMIFGSYPEVLKSLNREDKIEYLISLRDSYLLKDIFEMEQVRYPAKVFDLLKLLAFQIGNEVSLNELSNTLGIAKQSVERYLYLLEKAFVIIKVKGFARNLRKEITKTSRYYFYDNGIRNALISNFNDLTTRNDIGMLWENFLFIERIKKQEYKRIYSNNYFWRTYDKKEVDMVEERDGKLFAYEFKYSAKKSKIPLAWKTSYPDSDSSIISKDNFLDFLI